MMIRGPLQRSALLLLCLVIPVSLGCQTVKTLSDKPRETIESPTVLLMPLDMELYLLTLGGLLEPRADWTQAAITHSAPLISEFVENSAATLIPYRAPEADRAEMHQQLQKLHEVVGRAILQTHTSSPELVPPTARKNFDWTLGKQVSILAEDTGADYALFIFLRDSYSSAERKAAMVAGVLVGAFTGIAVVPSGGQQMGFASLVDLRDGHIMWFNFLRSAGGDVRDEDNARKTINGLLKDIPL